MRYLSKNLLEKYSKPNQQKGKMRTYYSFQTLKTHRHALSQSQNNDLYRYKQNAKNKSSWPIESNLIQVRLEEFPPTYYYFHKNRRRNPEYKIYPNVAYVLAKIDLP